MSVWPYFVLLLLFYCSRRHKQRYEYSLPETPTNMHARHITWTWWALFSCIYIY